MKRRTYIGILFVIIILAVGGIIAWQFLETPRAVLNPGWNIYENKTYGLSFEYPPSLAVTEDTSHGYYSVAVGDPKTHTSYLSIEVPDDRAEAERTLTDYLTGPYPKTVPASGIASARTVVQRTLPDGLRGIEFYGYDGEGGSYSDAVVYAGMAHIWQIVLDPVLEGRITEYGELGRLKPDKNIYDRILASLRITDAPSVIATPLTDSTDVPWAGIYHAAPTENGLKTYASTTLGVSVKYPADYLLFTRGNAGIRTILITPATSTLQAIARANAGSYGEAPGAITLSFLLDSGGETLSSLPVWLGVNTNISNFDPTNDPAIQLASTTVAGLPALSYRTSLGLAPYEYRVLVRDGQVVLISASDIPEQDFKTVLTNLTLTP